MDEEIEDLLQLAYDGNREAVFVQVDLNPQLLTRRGHEGFMLLHASCSGNHFELARGLLDRDGSTITTQDDTGWDALLYACSGDLGPNRTQLVTLLLDRGALLSTTSMEGFTCLHRAATWAHFEICLLLVIRGADLFALDRNGESAEALINQSTLTAKGKARLMSSLRLAFAQGPHESQVQRRKNENWARRWPLMKVLAGHDFLPTASRRLALELLRPALPTHVTIPPLPNRTRAQRRNNLMFKIFGNLGLVHRVVAYL